MKALLTLVGLAVCALVVGLSAYPWTMRGTVRRAALAAAMGRDIGLDVTIAGPITVKLLPRPRVQIIDATFRAVDGSIDLSAPALTGELDVGALLHGQWRLVSVTLLNPTATIDLDRSGHRSSISGLEQETPFKVSVRSGLVRLVSRRLGADTLLTDLSATADTVGGGRGTMSATGRAVWRGVPGQFSVQLGAPKGEAHQSNADVRITSPAGALSAFGVLSTVPQPQFIGRLSVSSGAPQQVLDTLGFGPIWFELRKASLSGDAVAKLGDVSLSDATLRLNATAFEGTLGYRSDNGHTLFEGTLATGVLDVGALAGHSIDRAGLAEAYRTALVSPLRDANLDLRLSAGEVVVGPARAQDVAFSVLCRDRRLEATIDEAQTFGGVLKARLIGALLPDGIEAHAELALSGMDLGRVGIALVGQERLTGALTGKVAVDGHGERLSDIVPTLAGEGQVFVQDGSVMGVSVSQALKRFARRLPMGVNPFAQITTFATASSAMRIAQGNVTFVDGKVAGPGINLTFGGHSDLPRGKLDIVAMASPTDAAGTPIAGTPGLPIEMSGGWDEPLVLMEQNHRLPLPNMLLPDLDPSQSLP